MMVVFIFLSFVVYEEYCEKIKIDLDCVVVFEFVEKIGCIKCYDCYFMWLVFEGDVVVVVEF